MIPRGPTPPTGMSGGVSPRASVSERSGGSSAVHRPCLHHTEAKREQSGETKRARLHPEDLSTRTEQSSAPGGDGAALTHRGGQTTTSWRRAKRRCGALAGSAISCGPAIVLRTKAVSAGWSGQGGGGSPRAAARHSSGKGRHRATPSRRRCRARGRGAASRAASPARSASARTGSCQTCAMTQRPRGKGQGRCSAASISRIVGVAAGSSGSPGESRSSGRRASRHHRSRTRCKRSTTA